MRARLVLALAAAATLAGAAGAPRDAAAQGGADVDLSRGPTAELYIRKRPAAPEAPSLSPELQALLIEAEKERDAKRAQAIGLLREFLDGKPEGSTRAEGLFKLGELLWEDARRVFLENMDDYERAVEACKQRKCKKAPVEPRVDLSESERLFRTLRADHPDFRHMDLVTYLIGFAAKEDGREQEALGFFQEVIAKYPSSPLFGDSWMMVGEHFFAAENWEEARAAYAQILSRPDAATYDLALFKTAWCDWKLGDVDLAAQRLKDLLGLAAASEVSGSAAQRRRRANLRDEALDYLVIIFTEDRSISAKEVYDFLASIGGDRYSRDVLIKVAEAYFGQSEYERSSDTYAFLIGLDPAAVSAATWQRKIVENWVSALDGPRARAEMKVLVDTYGPASAWAQRMRGQSEALARSLATTEQLVRTTATNFHAEAQAAEKAGKGKINVAAYEAAAEAYTIYLAGFGDGEAASEHAAELRYYLADILYFKLGRHEAAGDQYLAVGKSAPVGKWHKPALRQAIDAFEKARPKDAKPPFPVDKKFGEAMDLYATLFKDDPEIVGLIFKNGQMFFDSGDYDEAIKRFGLIITEYPDHPDALAAGDRILKALVQGKDYETIEEWARRLKQTKAFAAKAEQERLDKLIVESIGKSGDTYAEAGKYEQAAGFYLRVPKEFAKHKSAPQMMMNAGVMYEKAKKPERAAEVYLDLADRYPDGNLGDKAAFSAGQLYEKVAYFDRAAEAYELVVAKFGKSKDAADALYNAGVLRQALGQHDKAIAHYQAYAKRYRDRKDAAEVAFRIGAVYEEAGDDGRADKAFREFARTHRGHRRVIEAHVRAGRAAFRLGQLKRAADELGDALKLWKKVGRDDKEKVRPWAAEARYWQAELIFRDYEKVSLAVKPKQLDRVLEKKTDLLIKAQEVYASVIDYEDLRWATAALYRIGQTFELFADELRNAPVPAGMSEEEAEAYRGALDMKVVEIEDMAIQRYAAGYQRSIELQVYDQYTSKIREALGRLNPDEFPPEREGRAELRTGTRDLPVRLVREVNR